MNNTALMKTVKNVFKQIAAEVIRLEKIERQYHHLVNDSERMTNSLYKEKLYYEDLYREIRKSIHDRRNETGIRCEVSESHDAALEWIEKQGPPPGRDNDWYMDLREAIHHRGNKIGRRCEMTEPYAAALEWVKGVGEVPCVPTLPLGKDDIHIIAEGLALGFESVGVKKGSER